jgi:hypothetical protein
LLPSAAEPDEHLVQHDVVQHLDAVRRAEPVRDPARALAAARDQRIDPVSAERSQRRVDRRAARPARGFRRPVLTVALALRGANQVRRALAHGGRVRGGVRDDDEAGVVGG